MITLVFVIAVLLFCLVLANEQALAWLGQIIVLAGTLALIAAGLAVMAGLVFLSLTFWSSTKLILGIAFVGYGLWSAGREPPVTRQRSGAQV